MLLAAVMPPFDGYGFAQRQIDATMRTHDEGLSGRFARGAMPRSLPVCGTTALPRPQQKVEGSNDKEEKDEFAHGHGKRFEAEAYRAPASVGGQTQQQENWSG